MVENKLAFISNPKPYEKIRYNVPRMYVKTKFNIRQNTTPLFILAGLTEEKRVNIPINCEDLSIDKLIPLLSNIIIKDNLIRKGKTRFWDDVTSYYYQDYKDRFSIEYDLNGKVIEINTIEINEYDQQPSIRF